MSEGNIIFNWIVPIIGDILLFALFLSPLPDVLRIQKAKKLGDFDPIPYAMMVVNCSAWTIYGLQFEAPTIFFVCLPNMIGIPVGFYTFAVTYPLSSEEVRNSMHRIMSMLTMGIVPFLFFVYASTGGKSPFPELLGTVIVFAQLSFFASPLNSILEIIRTKSSSSIHLGLAITGTASSLLWSSFGLVTGDWFMFIPNFCSVTLGVTQLSLRMIYGGRSTKKIFDVEDKEEHSETDQSMEDFHAGII